jgi:hypothetical protein
MPAIPPIPGLIVPKIIYPSGGPNSFTFLLAPRMVPYRDYAVVRHDNISSSGAVERIFERRDDFLSFSMEYVFNDTDVAAWDAFMQVALTGQAFDYYPNSLVGAFTTYLLEATTWTPAFKQLGAFHFQCKFRKRVPWP